MQIRMLIYVCHLPLLQCLFYSYLSHLFGGSDLALFVRSTLPSFVLACSYYYSLQSTSQYYTNCEPSTHIPGASCFSGMPTYVYCQSYKFTLESTNLWLCASLKWLRNQQYNPYMASSNNQLAVIM